MALIAVINRYIQQLLESIAILFVISNTYNQLQLHPENDPDSIEIQKSHHSSQKAGHKFTVCGICTVLYCINCARMPNFHGFTVPFPVSTFLSCGICILPQYERIFGVV